MHPFSPGTPNGDAGSVAPQPERAERAAPPGGGHARTTGTDRPATSGRLPLPRLAGWVLFGAVLVYALLLRGWDLGSRPFTVDEAESSINALTILEHGLPTDRYLGLPIYENALTRPWPESPEYEFQDSSYSANGVAVYHGWFPLYLLAAGYAAAGVGPDRDAAALTVRHSDEEIRRRTAVGRVPAVLTGAVFLVFLFLAARELYGMDAAWAALAAGTVCQPVIYFARQARYYSATLALAAGCCLAVALMVRRGRWLDYVLGAVLFVLLFHTHVLTFVSLCAAFGLTVPFWGLRPGRPARLAAFAALVAAGVFPWAVLSGFVASAVEIPKAFPLLSSQDMLVFVRRLGPMPALAALLPVVALAVWALRGRLPPRLTRPLTDHLPAFLFLALWTLTGLAAFVAFVPAVSFFHGRLVLTILVPGLLLGALCCAALARAVAPRFAAPLAAGLFVLAFALVGQATFRPKADAPDGTAAFDVIDDLRSLKINPGTRLYATPNQHLVLTFYTGIPVQSVAPVRKSFLDAYPGELIILEAGPRFEPLTADDIRLVLREAGRPASDEQVRQLEELLRTRLLREELRGRVARVTPEPEPPPAFVDGETWDRLLDYQRAKTAEGVRNRLAGEGNPMFNGHPLSDHGAWWQTFYYRFVGPADRSGANLNYADRVKNAEAIVLPSGWVCYRCPALPR